MISHSHLQFLQTKEMMGLTLDNRPFFPDFINFIILTNFSCVQKMSFHLLIILLPFISKQLIHVINNMDELLRNERQKYYQQVEGHFLNATEIGEDYEINKIWEERPVV